MSYGRGFASLRSAGTAKGDGSKSEPRAHGKLALQSPALATFPQALVVAVAGYGS
jgi:hypothetical protein